MVQKCNPGAARLAAAVNRRSTLSLIALLLVLSAMPDTMAAPVLKELFVDRYGATVKEAQVFMAINLLGAVAAVPLLLWWRRRAEPVRMLVIASLADAVLLGLLSAPIGLWSSLAVRAAEGITDVVVFASLFDLVRRNSGPHAARGLGLASTPLLLGLGLGAVAGGLAAQRVAGVSDDAASSSRFCCRLTRFPVYAGPAMRAIARTDGSATATMGATMPPSLCPTSAMRVPSMSERERRYATIVRTSSATSALVPRCALSRPPEAPTPRSSQRKTAMPRRPSESAMSRKSA